MTALEAVAHKIDDYSGEAANVVPPVGVIAVPLKLLAELRKALRA